MGRFQLSPILAMAYSSLRPFHSISMKAVMNRRTVKADFLPSNAGNVKSELENISERILMACVTFSALKKIQANTVSAKVPIIIAASRAEGRMLSSATLSKKSLFLLVSNNGKK